MKKIFKYLGFLISALVLLFLFVVNFSQVETKFQCPGEMSYKDAAQSTTVYVRLEEYRWWVGLWSDSDASLYLEIPNSAVEYFEYIEKGGDNFFIYETYPAKKRKGIFSALSKALAIETSFGFFDGRCKELVTSLPR